MLLRQGPAFPRAMLAGLIPWLSCVCCMMTLQMVWAPRSGCSSLDSPSGPSCGSVSHLGTSSQLEPPQLVKIDGKWERMAQQSLLPAPSVPKMTKLTASIITVFQRVHKDTHTFKKLSTVHIDGQNLRKILTKMVFFTSLGYAKFLN